MLRSVTISMVVAATVAGPLAAQNLVPPPDWQWIPDRPARLVNSQFTGAPPDSEFRFVMMPPGYHITTGPGMTLFHPANRADGRFAIESEIFLFPNSVDAEFGLFIGGADLGTEGRQFTAFVVRPDRSIAVRRHTGHDVTSLVPWTHHEAIQVPDGDRPAKNVVRVEAEPLAVTFLVNGVEVARVPRDSLVADGLFGFRLGSGINLHVTTLDVTRRLAPPRSPQQGSGI